MSAEKKSGFGGGMFGKDSGITYDVYLNLTPLMDVMSNILFFLLAAFGASSLAILATTVPVQSSEETSIAADDDKVTVTVRAETSGGFSIQCESVSMTKEQLRAYGARLPKIDGKFDYPGLTAGLKRVKERFPGSSSMILVPDDEIPYDQIVKIMDAARELKLPDGRKIILFPEVVLSGIFKG
ncbi:MAG: biopolymer transporter ExbD [Deltaproteobacteria bacterium]|nr:biopolymer transporter ExbD [Deltaproteobacteria bacterium]